MSSTHVVTVTAGPDEAAADAGAAALREGKLFAFPTETVYGIAADASRPDTMRRLRELKDRPDRPFSVHLGDPEQITHYVRELPSEAGRLVRAGWPGPVTLIVPTGGRLAREEWNTPALREELLSDGWIGLRCPDEPTACRMLAGVDAPVVAPSANLAGQPSPRSGKEALAAVGGRVDLLLDAGGTRLGTDSTIVRIGSDGGIELLRRGAHSLREVRRMIRRRHIFVCTGNTCRSPMAAGLAKKLLAGKLDCRVGELRKRLYEISSAGVFATEGSPPTQEAARAASQRGADIRRHRSRRLTSELIQSADLIFCMTAGHVEQAVELAPEQAEKIRRLDGDRDIADPIGGGMDVYRETAEQIEHALRRLWDEGSL